MFGIGTFARGSWAFAFDPLRLPRCGSERELVVASQSMAGYLTEPTGLSTSFIGWKRTRRALDTLSSPRAIFDDGKSTRK
jgi:hypothetical protein